ncbi:14641_t:CDS:2 [Dentiscutata erythropus]|uniref:14641_t:CDS:1 n=1 Tax=Dentiscutata erythropus TaxID=1348616 RepID=A0A9N9FNA9_9GLOM|nr:14641_t:CDS:2 [Dentiscutata erythropus]
MNKKYILCVFVVMIAITNSSYASPAYSKPMSKRASPAPMSNTAKILVDDVNNLNAVGKLEILKFATKISAAYFYPGYNNGQPGQVGKVAAKSGYMYEPFTENPITYDFALIKLDYPEGRKLQDDTGAFDYDLDIPRDNYPVNVFGYPIDGDMNCPKDGQHLCEYEGLSFDMPPDVPNPQSYRAITIDVATNIGNVMGVSHVILPEPYPDETAAWSWTHNDFAVLLNYAENN